MSGPIFSPPGEGVAGGGTADARPPSKAGIATKPPVVNKSRRVKPAARCLNDVTNELMDISFPLIILDCGASMPLRWGSVRRRSRIRSERDQAAARLDIGPSESGQTISASHIEDGLLPCSRETETRAATGTQSATG